MKKRIYAKNIRLKEFNYKQDGFYFITICTSGKKKILPAYKEMLERELLNLKKRFKFIEIEEKVFIDNHCHLIIKLENANVSLAKVIQAYKSITTLNAKKNGYEGKRFWQPNYYEHIIRSEQELLKVKLYIKANPYEERIDWKKFDDYICSM